MSTHPLESLLGTSMEKIKEMVDVNTVVGDPITEGGNIIIPVSKVSFGFASGGSDFPSKNPKELFGGGSGAGVTISPVAFLVIGEGGPKLVQFSTADNTNDRLVNMIPEVLDKITSYFKKDNKEKPDETLPS